MGTDWRMNGLLSNFRALEKDQSSYILLGIMGMLMFIADSFWNIAFFNLKLFCGCIRIRLGFRTVFGHIIRRKKGIVGIYYAGFGFCIVNGMVGDLSSPFLS